MSKTKNHRDLTVLAKLFSIASLLSFFASTALAGSLTETLRVGPAYIEKPGEISVVVELPPGAAPKASDFKLLIDHKQVAKGNRIKSFEESGKGMSLLFCVDVSGSMKGGPLEETREALLSFLGAASKRPLDKFSLISFADDVVVESPFNNKPEQLEAKVRDINPRGHQTALYHAIYRALTSFEGRDLPERRRVIVISDGKDEGSTETQENVTTKANTLGIPVDAIGRGKIEKQYLDSLSGLSVPTGGGEPIEARPDVLSLRDAIARLYRDLLVTRSFVVYFAYATEKSGAKTNNAEIELRQLGGKPLSASVLGEVPLPLHNTWPYRSVILALIIAIAISSVFMIRRRKEGVGKTGEDVVGKKPFYDENRERPVSVSSPIKTVVGGSQFPFPGPARPAAVLTGVAGTLTGKRYEVGRELFRIGADPESDLCITEDEFVSSKHAHLRYEEGGLFVFDEGSRNGTFVNHERVGNVAMSLKPGDRLQVGNTAFKVEAYSG